MSLAYQASLASLIEASGDDLDYVEIDLHNIYTNHGFDAEALLVDLELERVGEIHVAGGMGLDGFYLNAHSDTIPDAVWSLLEWTLPRCPNIGGVTRRPRRRPPPSGDSRTAVPARRQQDRRRTGPLGADRCSVEPTSLRSSPCRNARRGHERHCDMKATWNGATLAESDDTVVVEGNHYFPEASLKREYVTFSNHRSMCPWKGEAHYFSLMVEGDLNPNAVWYYPEPKEAAKEIKGRVAFWKGVKIA